MMMSPLWRHPITWRHRDHAQSIARGHFPIGCPLKPSRYLASFLRYLAPNFRQRLLRDDVINYVIRPGSTIREEHIDTPCTGTLWYGHLKLSKMAASRLLGFGETGSTSNRSAVPELSVRTTNFPKVVDRRVEISAQSDKNSWRRSILKMRTDRLTSWHPDR